MANKKSPASLPNPTYKVESNEQELKMTYGMYNDIMRLIGDPAQATRLLITDAVTRDLVIRRLFTDNKKSVEKTDELIEAFEIEILPSDLDGILSWVADHVAYFLSSTGRKMETMMEKYVELLPPETLASPSSNQSNPGSEASAPSNSSAGPTTTA